jgi:hypothetical protein
MNFKIVSELIINALTWSEVERQKYFEDSTIVPIELRQTLKENVTAAAQLPIQVSECHILKLGRSAEITKSIELASPY